MTNLSKPKKKPWPTKKAMEQIYTMKLWGDDGTAFYSGDGSHHANLVDPYIACLRTFLDAFEEPIVLCDLGCGDFNIGKKLVEHTKEYVAVDIVSELIAYNSSEFKSENLRFRCLDIAVDDLPPGDCAVLRQVLQHLSNAEIQRVISKLSQFKYVILTEHIPNGEFIPNKDIISGQGIRLKKQSGLSLLQAPFLFQVKKEQELLAVNLGSGKGIVVTTLYTI
ncbi:MAG: class I SAM-dependent methyltransferase [Crocinitomicaceae bacterium]|nr:class I SAM-dependent methyltransferase [Crocinitomicaceae bacterium]MDG1777170.1 class I SAM-dependent methyltransferase [Crocinitomicaceae bacterium]